MAFGNCEYFSLSGAEVINGNDHALSAVLGEPLQSAPCRLRMCESQALTDAVSRSFGVEDILPMGKCDLMEGSQPLPWSRSEPEFLREGNCPY